MAGNDNEKTNVVIDDPANRGAIAERETTRTKLTQWWYERERKPFWLGWLVLAGGLAGLWIWGATGIRADVEDDIGDRARDELRQLGFAGVEVDVDGRDVKLSGALPPGADEKRVLALVKDLTGVRVVEGDFDREQAGGGTPTATPAGATATSARTNTPAPSPTTVPPTATPTAAAPTATPTAAAATATPTQAAPTPTPTPARTPTPVPTPTPTEQPIGK